MVSGVLGHASAIGELELVVGETREVVFPPADASRILVRVVDHEDQPVPGAQVHLYQRVDRGGGGIGRFVTDATGSCLVSSLERKDLDLWVKATGFAPLEVVDVAGEVRGGELDLHLDLESSFRFLVLDARGDPVPDIQVEVSKPFRAMMFFLPPKGRSDRQGIAVLNELQPVEYNVSFSKNGQIIGRTAARAEVGREVEVELIVPDLVAVTGTIARNGEPVSAGHVSLESTVTMLRFPVSEDGSFAGVAPAGTSYKVSHRAKDGVAVRFADRALSGDTVLDLAYEGHALRVNVVSPGDDPVPALWLRLESSAPEGTEFSEASHWLNNSNQHTWFGVPAGTYELSARSAAGGSYPPRVTVHVEGDTEVRYALEVVEPLALNVRGSVPRRVRAHRLDEHEKLVPLVMLGRDPLRFEWPAGRDGVGVLESASSVPLFFRVTDGTPMPSAVSFEEGGALRVTVAPRGGAVRGARFRVRPREAEEDHRPYWQERVFHTHMPQPPRLAPGEYVVQVLFSDGSCEERQVTIQSGETTTVNLSADGL